MVLGLLLVVMVMVGVVGMTVLLLEVNRGGTLGCCDQACWLDMTHGKRRQMILFDLWLKLERGHRRLLWFLLVPLLDYVVASNGSGHKLVVKLVLKLLLLKVLLGRGRG